MVKVSVVMSCYNSERFLKESIDSILNQTFKDFEFIVWNDGSTDNTEHIINSYNDNRIRYFSHENTGLGMALKLACEKAEGEYIARMDDDDISIPDRLAKQVAFLDNHKDFVLVSSSTFFINEEGKLLGRSFPVTWNSNIKYQLSISNPITHPASMFRREDYVKAGGYLNFRSSQDKILWSRLSNYGMFGNIEEPLLYYRMRIGSISRSRATSSYRPLLIAITNKICHDEIVNPDDIELFNIIDKYRRKYTNKTQEKDIYYIKGAEEKLYELMRRIVSDLGTERFIFLLKNIGVWVVAHLKK